MGGLFERIIVILFAFAVLDLIVGVANDAVNFLNSAIGSKVAPKKVILIIASIGILLGVLFSTGMMEVARKGIFNPGMFSFQNIMIIFVAVVITDVLLLDFYNTLRLPTSTTVSLIFELLGGALAVALLHILDIGASFQTITQYINRENASDIVSSILLSVAISFSVGMIIQYITRFFFTYNYEQKLRTYGGVFGGLAITAITYFLLFKGLKESTLISKEQFARLQEHIMTVLLILFCGWTVVLQFFQSVLKWNVLKIVVLVGTFSLAAAFAGNDLVNFIGVSMAGYNSYLLYAQSGATDPTTFLMTGLAGKVPTQFYMLLIAGIIMVWTLWTNRKASSVTDTEIGLTKQQEGTERFTPGFFSRTLVRHCVKVHKVYERIIPFTRRDSLQKRFEKSTEEFHKQREAPAFDLIRASVNLTVASILIAIATSLKLPLSTTYVTFMVAMGTALADGVRGRDSAVYRVTGVLTVIGGWFMTAISAFFMTAIVATIIWFGGSIAIGVLLALTFILLYKTHIYHAKEVKKEKKEDQLSHQEHGTLWDNFRHHVITLLPKVCTVFCEVCEHIIKNQDHALKKDAKEATELTNESKIIKSHLHHIFVTLPIEVLGYGEKYVQAIDYLRKTTLSLESMAQQARDYALNQHPDLTETQQEELSILHKKFCALCHHTVTLFEKEEIIELDDIDADIEELLGLLETDKKAQLTRIKNNELGVRNTSLYLHILLEIKNSVVYHEKMLHLGRKLFEEKEEKKD